MNTEDLRALAERAETVKGREGVRLAELHGRIRTARRRRTAAVAAGTAAVVLAVVVGGTFLVETRHRGQGPIQHPTPTVPTPTVPEPPATAPVRQVTYTDQYWPTHTIQYGDRTVDISNQVAAAGRADDIPGVVHMDVTDDGVVFTTEDGKIWFTDGSAIHQIGNGEGYFSLRAAANVVSGTAGSRVAWVAGYNQDAEIVVYDTKADREAARVPAPDCTDLDPGFSGAAGKPHRVCELTSLVNDDHVYFTVKDVMHLHPDVPMRLDVATRALEQVTDDDLATDLARSPRGLIVGDSPETGVVSDGYGAVFAVKGARLVPMRASLSPSDPYNSRTAAFDTGTRQPLYLQVPAGYHGSDEFTAFEWVDDDRLALMNAANAWRQTTGDILVCQISTGHCEVAAPAKRPNTPGGPRIAPHLGLPG